MAIAGLRLEPSRDLLSHAIVESLKSWPELHRRIFIDIHYHGRPVDEISLALGLRQSEVIQILQHCERQLYHALRVLRDGASGDASPDTVSDLPAYSNHCCRC
jgi:DNA-directed RNA polymerase specialized sigma24 family protein